MPPCDVRRPAAPTCNRMKAVRNPGHSAAQGADSLAFEDRCGPERENAVTVRGLGANGRVASEGERGTSAFRQATSGHERFTKIGVALWLYCHSIVMCAAERANGG